LQLFRLNIVLAYHIQDKTLVSCFELASRKLKLLVFAENITRDRLQQINFWLRIEIVGANYNSYVVNRILILR